MEVLTPQTVELLTLAVTSLGVVFLTMLMLNVIADFVQRIFWTE